MKKNHKQFVLNNNRSFLKCTKKFPPVDSTIENTRLTKQAREENNKTENYEHRFGYCLSQGCCIYLTKSFSTTLNSIHTFPYLLSSLGNFKVDSHMLSYHCFFLCFSN